MPSLHSKGTSCLLAIAMMFGIAGLNEHWSIIRELRKCYGRMKFEIIGGV